MKILITAGGTREYIDPVRYITNASSGKMGYALAQAAAKAGHAVVLISAPTHLKTPENIQMINILTSGEMFQAVKDNFDKCDCLIMAAAVSDYTPVKTSKAKLKKQPGKLTMELKPTRDILKWAGQHKKGRIVAGFALETENLLENAEKKFKSKKMDVIIANSIDAIAAEKSTVYIKTSGSDWLEITSDKRKSAQKIIKIIETLAK